VFWNPTRKEFSSAIYCIKAILFYEFDIQTSNCPSKQMDSIVSLVLVGVGSALVAASTQKISTQTTLDSCIAKATQPYKIGRDIAFSQCVQEAFKVST
jgi:hypothetical protein